MHKRAALLLLCIFLTACGEVEEPICSPTPEPKPSLRESSQSTEWNGYTVTEITPVTAFDSTTSRLTVYPYNDSDKHIIIEEFYTSDNHFFDTVVAECSEDNKETKENLVLFTLQDGTTHALVTVDEDKCLHVYGKLQSSYIKKVAEQFL